MHFATVVILVVTLTAFCAAFSYFGRFIHMQVSCRCYLSVAFSKKLDVFHWSPEEGGRDHVIPYNLLTFQDQKV